MRLTKIIIDDGTELPISSNLITGMAAVPICEFVDQCAQVH